MAVGVGGVQPELGSTVRLGRYLVYSPSPREESGTFGLSTDFGMNGGGGGMIRSLVKASLAKTFSPLPPFLEFTGRKSLRCSANSISLCKFPFFSPQSTTSKVLIFHKIDHAASPPPPPLQAQQFHSEQSKQTQQPAAPQLLFSGFSNWLDLNPHPGTGCRPADLRVQELLQGPTGAGGHRQTLRFSNFSKFHFSHQERRSRLADRGAGFHGDGRENASTPGG